MEIIYRAQEEFLEHYQSFFEEQRLPFAYHPFMLKYHQLIAKPYFDASFLIVENKKCVGICYCPIYEVEGKKTISNNGGYTLAPFATNERIYKEIFSRIDEIALQHHCVAIKFYQDAFSILSLQNHTPPPPPYQKVQIETLGSIFPIISYF